MADGSIRINTQLDNDEISGDIKDLEKMTDDCAKHIKNAFDTISTSKGCEQAIQRQVNALQKAKEKADEYERQLADVESQLRSMEAKALKDADIGFKGDTPRKIQDRADNALLDNKDYQKLLLQAESLNHKWDSQNQKIKQASGNVKELENKMSSLNMETTKASSNMDKLKSSSKGVKGNVDSAKNSTKDFGTQVTRSVDHGVRKLGRMALAIFSIRTAYTLVSKAANQYLQTNENMANQVQGIWTTMGNVLGPIINTIVGYISKFISYINAIVKALTGVDLIARANASALKNQANATKGVAKATKDASRQLASFDEMNKLNANKDSSSGSGNDLQLFTPESMDVSGIADKMKELFEPLKNAWANYGEEFTNSFKFALGEIWYLIKSIGKSFKEVWLNGTGELTCSLILQILTDVFNIVGNIAKGFSEAWNKAGLGTSIIQHLWNMLNNVLKVIKSITNFVNELVKKIDWTPILQGLYSILGLLDKLTEIGSRYFDEFLKSILNGDWSSAGQAISDVFKEQFKAIQDWLASIDWFQLGYDIAKFITDGLMNLIDMLLHVDWIGVVSSISTLILEAVMSASELLYGLIGGFLTSIWESITTALAPERFAKFLQGVVEAIFNAFMNIGQWFHDKFNEAYTFICNIFSPIGGWFEQRKQDIFNAFGSIGYWFSDTFGGAYATATIAFKDAGKFFSGVWSNIKSAFGNISEWFRSTFSQAWTAVKNVFSTGGKIFDGIKDGILNGLKAVINALISGINKVVAIPFNGINSALKAIRNISFLGISPFGFLGTISVPQIPKLAKGGIVNNPGPGVNMGNYIAGEKGPEAIMPITDSQFIADFAEEIAKRIDTSQPINIVLKIGDKEFYKWFINMKKKYDFVMGG